MCLSRTSLLKTIFVFHKFQGGLSLESRSMLTQRRPEFRKDYLALIIMACPYSERREFTDAIF